MSTISQTYTDLAWKNLGDYNAVNSFTAETNLLAGVNEQPVLPAFFFLNNKGKTCRFLASGVLSTTGTPTYTFFWRLSTSPAVITGTAVWQSAAITTASGVTNQQWDAVLDFTCYTPGIGSGNTTLSGRGWVESPGGFASPFKYAMEPTTPPTATWTNTVDESSNLYLTLSVACSANSASNTLTLKLLQFMGLN